MITTFSSLYESDSDRSAAGRNGIGKDLAQPARIHQLGILSRTVSKDSSVTAFVIGMGPVRCHRQIDLRSQLVTPFSIDLIDGC